MAELITLSVTLATVTTLGPGALAPADPGCLEAVEMNRITNGWGLARLGGPDSVKIATESCEFLGWRGVVLTEAAALPVYVVDCQQRAETPRLSELGILADVEPGWGLGHEEGVLILWE